MNGVKVFSSQGYALSNQLDFSFLESGNYLIRLDLEDKVMINKIVIE